jgi:hypothetical protein
MSASRAGLIAPLAHDLAKRHPFTLHFSLFPEGSFIRYPLSVTVIPPFETNSAAIHPNEALVVDCSFVGISAKICYHLLGRAKGFLAVNDPFLFVQDIEECLEITIQT